KSVSMRELLASFRRHGVSRVTDLHLKVGEPPIYRVDGQLKKTNGAPLTEQVIERIVRTLIDDAEWRTLETARSVNNSHLIDDMRFRVNVFYDRKGLAAAIRALETTLPPVEKIGFPNRVWEDIVQLRQGLVLLTGATGMGKSTTIASLLERIARDRACHIITLEDPIEYHLDPGKSIISQRAVGRDVPDYERGLRDCLREDPDVIFVGEMTDQESTAWTLTAAETGHLVFSALHTRDTTGSISRLIDIFPSARADEVAHQLSLSLRYIIGQKLVPRRDRNGRVAAMEILHNNFAVSNLIRQNRPEQMFSLLQTMTRDEPEQRMCTMERSLAQLVRSGVIDRTEAELAANHRELLVDELERNP
ncbi:MAG: PilT/PilU family type 4a pilus ATPase, partial [Planctomycetota bacterium]